MDESEDDLGNQDDVRSYLVNVRALLDSFHTVFLYAKRRPDKFPRITKAHLRQLNDNNNRIIMYLERGERP